MKFTLFFSLLFCVPLLWAQEDSNPEEESYDEQAYQHVIDSITNSFTFQKGIIVLGNDLAELHVPEGFGYLDGTQSQRLLSDLWGNPPQETLGMLVPENMPLIGQDFTYAIEITYSEDGYIDDDDADDIDYDDLLEEMQKDAVAANEQRKQMGYGTVDIVGWASKPFYDQQSKKLHWAKELRFEGDDVNTLNYNIRILGRKGYLTMNAISDMDRLPLVKENVDGVIASVSFTEGNRYADFNPDLDEVAAYGIGGLIAGKILAKAGFFAALLKFWKVIAVGAVAAFGFFRRKLFGGKGGSNMTA